MNTPTALALHQAARRWLLAAQSEPAIVVQVAEIKGSTPRATDARMLVSDSQVLGTIGGGHLEWRAIGMARSALREASGRITPWQHTFPLGPTLGQCCGGVVVLRFEPLNTDTLAQWPAPPCRFQLDLHGAGHVGQAVIKLLGDIDCRVRWIDQRLDDVDLPPGDRAALGLPTGAERAALPAHIDCLLTEDAATEAAQAPWGRHHLVMTHRHDLDLAIVDALLRREDVRSGQAWVGMIGSRTKRAAFEHRLLARGHDAATLARLQCPIGLPGIQGKEPAIIAIAVIAQLLQGGQV